MHRFCGEFGMTEVDSFSYRKPPPDGGGGPLAVEGGKKCSFYLFLSLEDSAVIYSDLNFII